MNLNINPNKNNPPINQKNPQTSPTQLTSSKSTIKKPLDNASTIGSHRKQEHIETTNSLEFIRTQPNLSQRTKVGAGKFKLSRSLSPPRPLQTFYERVVKSTKDRVVPHTDDRPENDQNDSDSLVKIRDIQQSRSLISRLRTDSFDKSGGVREKLEKLKNDTPTVEDIKDALTSIDNYINQKEGQKSEKIPILKLEKKRLQRDLETLNQRQATADAQTVREMIASKSEDSPSFLAAFKNAVGMGTITDKEASSIVRNLIITNAKKEASNNERPDANFMRANSTTTNAATFLWNHLLAEVSNSAAIQTALKEIRTGSNEGKEIDRDVNSEILEDKTDKESKLKENREWLKTAASNIINQYNDAIENLPKEKRELVAELAEAYYSAAKDVAEGLGWSEEKTIEFARKQASSPYVLRVINPALNNIEGATVTGRRNQTLVSKLVQSVANRVDSKDQHLKPFTDGDLFITSESNTKAMEAMTNLLLNKTSPLGG